MIKANNDYYDYKLHQKTATRVNNKKRGNERNDMDEENKKKRKEKTKTRNRYASLRRIHIDIPRL